MIVPLDDATERLFPLLRYGFTADTRLGRSRPKVPTVISLVGEGAGYITGQNLNLEGGLTISTWRSANPS